MRKRTKARELALQFLYMLDVNKTDDMGGLQEFLQNESKDEEVLEYAKRMVEGVVAHKNDLDTKIQTTATNWDLHRMAAIDRNILRISVFEIVECEDIPGKVAINEAVDLGKKFSTANSGSFINGVLDKVRLTVES